MNNRKFIDAFNLFTILILASTCIQFGSDLYQILLQLQVTKATILDVERGNFTIILVTSFRRYELANTPLIISLFCASLNFIIFLTKGIIKLFKESKGLA